MPKTFTTTVSPLASDARVLHLEQLLTVSRSQAVGIVSMSWAWMLAEESEGVVPLPVTILDKVVDIEGAGQSLVDAGLVGVEPAGLVVPIGVRQAVDRASRNGESEDERRRRKDAERKQKSRKRRRLTNPSQPTRSKTSPPAAEATGTRPMSRSLGKVEGYPVMLIYRKDGIPFYKLAGATPEFTGTVTDPDNPSLADAFVALLEQMKRKAGKGLNDAATFRPTMEQVIDAAKREREQREASAVADAHRDEANKAFAEASAEDQDDHDQDHLERDSVTPVSASNRDTVTCPHDVTLKGSAAVAGSSCDDNGLGADSEGSKCHAPGHNAAPSSSSSSVFHSSREEIHKHTTTTSSVAAAKRDTDDQQQRREPDRLDLFLDSLKPNTAARPWDDAETAKRKERRAELAQRFAAALGVTLEAVIDQWKREPNVLRARLFAAGIDPNTGSPLAAEGAHEPAGARNGIDTTTEPIEGNKPAAGSVKAPGKDSGFRQSTEALNRLGITRTVNHAPPPDEDQEAFEDKRRRIADQLLRQGA
jgi:hypothetical protein